ncbi:FO synthase [Cupriavidus sp. UYMU48A]|nr:FO synthase [Cupriavidus sp. UYMU48A]
MDYEGLQSMIGDEWEDVSAVAAAKREATWGNVVTYSRKVFIPLTNLCRDQCGYCTFVKQPGEAGAGYLTPDDVLRIALRGEELGCKEALFSLGEKPELRYPEARAMLQALGFNSTIDYVVAMCELVLSRTTLVPHVNAGTLSKEELARVKNVAGSAGIMLENVSRRLVKVGMPHYACPDKVPVQRLRTLEAAGSVAIPMTTGMLIGIGETWKERVDTLRAIVEIHERFGNIQEVIVQNFRAKSGTLMASHPEPDMDDMLRTLVLARLMLPSEISLQAPPNLNESFEAYLDAGINDWGGISPLTADHINPERAWPAVDELARRTKRKGMTLVERLTTYPRYLHLANEFLSPTLFSVLRNHAREDGYAARQAHINVQYPPVHA